MADGPIVALALILSPLPATAQPPMARPALTITRYDEDWSRLRDPQAPLGRWTDALKYIPLDDGGGAYLTTGAEVRLRNESFRNNLWGDGPAPDDAYLWIRAMPYADLHVGAVRAFVQPIAGYAVGVAPSAGPIDRTGVDLLQGFAEVAAPAGDKTSVALRVGRQMLSLGTERLIGTRYGPNVPLAFDGVRAIVRTGPWAISLLHTRPVRPGTGDFDDRSAPGRRLWGAYAASASLDVYYLGYENRQARFDLSSGAGAERRHSFGVRSFRGAGDWRWNVEGVAQVGRLGDKSIRAWTVGTEVSRRFPAAPYQPSITARFDVVSGDRKRGDDVAGTFHALFPKGKYFGELSPIGPYNMINFNPAVAFDLGRGLTVGLAGQMYWRYARGDGVYDVPGNLIRPAGAAHSLFIGKQIEATADWQATSELELSASLSAFHPGGFIRETGPARTIAMLGLEANLRY